MIDQKLLSETNKRLTLNWLIQGAAQHAGMTFHHLVRDELDALSPKLLRLYDQYALINLLQYWQFEAALVFGSPRASGVAPNRNPVIRSSRIHCSPSSGVCSPRQHERALERCKEKGLTRISFLFSYQALFVIKRLKSLESAHRLRLIQLAMRSASTIWGIPIDRLDGDLGRPVPFGTPIRVRNTQAAFFRAATVGLGGVERRGETLHVVGKGTNWQLLTKELVKGTAELICMHGLCALCEDTYRKVMDAADRIEFEPWMLQTGGELWRRLLAVVPAGRPIAWLMMDLARLPADSLNSLVGAVIEHPERREMLANLGTEDAARDSE